jgi:hypothetical protein
LKRVMFMPTRRSFSSMGTEREAGPMVQTSLVFGTRASSPARYRSARINAMSMLAMERCTAGCRGCVCLVGWICLRGGGERGATGDEGLREKGDGVRVRVGCSVIYQGNTMRTIGSTIDGCKSLGYLGQHGLLCLLFFFFFPFYCTIVK